MSIIEDLEGLINCPDNIDCDTILKLILSEPECVALATVCEALKSAFKVDSEGNYFLDVPTSLRIPEIHLTGENPVVLEDTVWDDLRFPASALRVGSAQPASEQSYRGGIVLSFATNADNSIYFIAQMPHRWKEGSDIRVHIHWTISDDGVGGGAENVKWDLTYSMANIGGSFPAESSATVTADVQNDSAHDHLITGIHTIDMEGFTLSNCIIFSLTRDVGVANDYTHEAYLIEVDIHYQIDSLGSKEQFTK